jgi:hypothetical protein
MNADGDIVGLHSENIGLWQPQTGYYVSLHTSEYGFTMPSRFLTIATGTIHNRHLALHLHFHPYGHAGAQH